VPREIITISNAILGFGHCSLAKYLFISAFEDNPNLDINNIEKYFTHILERVDLRYDLHFHTETTIDTLDYTGTGFNKGSKVVIAAAGDKKRELLSKLPFNFTLPAGFYDPVFVIPGILVITAPIINNMVSCKLDVKNKHWGCEGPLVIDARLKPYHAPVLTEDKSVTKKIDKLFEKGGSLYRFKVINP